MKLAKTVFGLMASTDLSVEAFFIVMKIAFCPNCRQAARAGEHCPACGLPCNSPAESYPEKLLETILSPDTTRAGMAIDILAKTLRDSRSIVPLLLLLEAEGDPYKLVLAARGLGWLGDRQAVGPLSEMVLDEDKPFVARIAAVEALGSLGGKEARTVLEKAAQSRRPSVARAAHKTLDRGIS